MFYRALYQTNYSIPALSVNPDEFLTHRYFVLDEFYPHEGHMMMEAYTSQSIHILIAYPSYGRIHQRIHDRVKRYLASLHIVDDEEFVSSSLSWTSLTQDAFFEAMVQAALNYHYETKLGVFYENYYLEPSQSTKDKAIAIPRLDNEHIQILLREEKNTLDRIQPDLSKAKPLIIVLHEPNDVKAEAWYQWLSLQDHHSKFFSPSVQYCTELSTLMPLGELSRYTHTAFQKHILGNQWIIEIQAHLPSDVRFSKLVKEYFIPQVLTNAGLGQIILRSPSPQSLQGWFETTPILEIWDSTHETSFSQEPTWNT